MLESLLFALALAVGLMPELLPAVTTVSLAQGARRMADAGVIVKRLLSIEDFGSMTVLCADKTGTFTQASLRLERAVDVAGQPAEKLLHYAYLNAFFQTGYTNPIDEALKALSVGVDPAAYQKLDKLPFARKRSEGTGFRRPRGGAHNQRGGSAGAPPLHGRGTGRRQAA